MDAGSGRADERRSAAPADRAADAAPAAAALPATGETVVVPLTGTPNPAFDELYRQESTRMVRVAYLLTSSSAQAEEVVQDAFARVYERWDRIDNPGAYLRTCVVNGSKNLLRRRRLERERLRPEPRDTPELEYLHDALAALPAKRRAAIVLRYFDDLSEAEIAATLGVRPGTVKSLLHRGLAELKGVLRP